MKKLLSILSSIGLVATASTGAVLSSMPNESQKSDNLAELRAKQRAILNEINTIQNKIATEKAKTGDEQGTENVQEIVNRLDQEIQKLLNEIKELNKKIDDGGKGNIPDYPWFDATMSYDGQTTFTLTNVYNFTTESLNKAIQDGTFKVSGLGKTFVLPNGDTNAKDLFTHSLAFENGSKNIGTSAEQVPTDIKVIGGTVISSNDSKKPSIINIYIDNQIDLTNACAISAEYTGNKNGKVPTAVFTNNIKDFGEIDSKFVKMFNYWANDNSNFSSSGDVSTLVIDTSLFSNNGIGLKDYSPIYIKYSIPTLDNKTDGTPPKDFYNGWVKIYPDFLSSYGKDKKQISVSGTETKPYSPNENEVAFEWDSPVTLNSLGGKSSGFFGYNSSIDGNRKMTCYWGSKKFTLNFANLHDSIKTGAY